MGGSQICKKVDGTYYYPNGYEDGHTLSELKGGSDSSKDPDFDEKNFSEKNRLGDTELYGFKNKSGKTVIIEEDHKWELPEGQKLDSKLKKRLQDVEDEIASLREKGEKIDSDTWNKMVEEAIKGESSNKSSTESSSSKSSSKSSAQSDKKTSHKESGHNKEA